MQAKVFFEMVSQGARPVIRFTDGADDFQGYAEAHMRARVTGAVLEEDDFFKLAISYREFDAHNRGFESANYFDGRGNACLTAREVGDYQEDDLNYVSLEGELHGFEVEDEAFGGVYAVYLAERQAGQAYVAWLEQRVQQLQEGRKAPVAAGPGGRSHKQVLVMRKDLKMRAGKLAAQAAHASLGAVLSRARPLEVVGERGLFIPLDNDIGPWLEGHFTKIALGVDSEDTARELHAKAVALGIPCALIEDSGLTEFKGQPTITGLAVGPADAARVNEVTGHLPLNL